MNDIRKMEILTSGISFIKTVNGKSKRVKRLLYPWELEEAKRLYESKDYEAIDHFCYKVA